MTPRDSIDSAIAALAELQNMTDDELSARVGVLEELDLAAWTAVEETDETTGVQR